MTPARLALPAALATCLWSGHANAQPAAPAWQDRAKIDLTAMHDLLRDNSPAMVVDRDSAHFRRWLESGYRAGLRDADGVRDAHGYAFLLRRYANGFRDGHIFVAPRKELGPDPTAATAWPGFGVGLQAGRYRVVYRDRTVRAAPALGAELVSCDGRTAGVMSAARNGYDGDMSLEGGRMRAARYLLLDRGNPFAPRPEVCVFKTGAASRPMQLDWRPIPADALKALPAASIGGGGRLDARPWAGGKGWWLTVPSMDDNLDWNAFYAEVGRNLTALRGARRVVIDLRGNTGGSSAYGERLATLLWGEPMVSAHAPDLGPVTWRATKLNRDFWAGLVERLSANPNTDAETKMGVRATLAAYDGALRAGKPTFQTRASAPARAAPGPNPMAGRVILLTDSSCISACLDLMDLFLAMPGVTQAGRPTWADTIFMELTQVDALPSGLNSFGFGHKAWVERPRGSNAPYTPSPALTWDGAPDDDAALKAWLAKVTPQSAAPKT